MSFDSGLHSDFDSELVGEMIYGNDCSEFDGEVVEDDQDMDDCCDLLPGEDMDGDFDSAMASAGFGTDEDYGYYGDCDDPYDGMDYDFGMDG